MCSNGDCEGTNISWPCLERLTLIIDVYKFRLVEEFSAAFNANTWQRDYQHNDI